MAGNGITFDDISTGISYEQFPKDPAAREAIAIVNNKVEELKGSTVSRQDVINLENKVKQSELDKDNFKEAVNKELTDVKAVVDGIDGGNTAKLEELEAAIVDKANKDVVDSLLYQIEGSVKQINGNAPDENGNVTIDLNTTGLATKEEVQTKTDEIETMIFTKAEKSNVEMLENTVDDLTTQVGNKASAQSVTQLTSQLAETVQNQLDIVSVVKPTMSQTEIQAVLNSKSRVKFMSGIYNVDLSTNGIGFEFKSNSVIEWEKGAVIQALSTSKTAYKILKLDGIENVELINPFVIGERTTHLGSAGEWGMGLSILNTRNVIIRNPTCNNCWGDGLYIGSGNEVLFISRPICDNNRRNGGTLVSGKNITIENGIFRNTNGTPPAAGFDIEPNLTGETLEDIRLLNCVAYGNEKLGFALAPTKFTSINNSVILENCHAFNNPGHGFHFLGEQAVIYGTYKMINCTSYFNGIAGFDLRSPQNLELVGCDAYNNAQTNTSSRYGSGFTVYHDTGDIPPNSVYFKNCRAYDNQIVKTQSRGFFVGALATNINIINCISKNNKINGHSIDATATVFISGYQPQVDGLASIQKNYSPSTMRLIEKGTEPSIEQGEVAIWRNTSAVAGQPLAYFIWKDAANIVYKFPCSNLAT